MFIVEVRFQDISNPAGGMYSPLVATPLDTPRRAQKGIVSSFD
jgi:hypothetical protein